MKNKIYIVGIAAFLLVWLGLTGMAWFGKAEAVSLVERRALNQAPELSMKTILAKDVLDEDGNIEEAKSYKTLFERYSLDQFPYRDRFRQVKSIFSNYVMQQMDNNGYYVKEGYAAELVYPLEQKRFDWNLNAMRGIYDRYLAPAGCNVYTAIVPDKGYFLAEKHGYPALDYNQMFQDAQQNIPEGTYIDLTQTLTLEAYYATDTHWRQEKIVPVAQQIAAATGATVPAESDYTTETVENPFYGCYYGFAALPMDPEDMVLMRSEMLDQCRVQKFKSLGQLPGQVIWEPLQMYDIEKADSNDLYDIFFSGNQQLIQIVNPNATGNRELIIFGDSYARSLTPLLVGGYRKVTVVDLRQAAIRDVLDQYIKFNRNQDVLFLYGTISMNGMIGQ